MATKRIYMPEYELELNLGGTIVQMGRDKKDFRPYIDVPEELEHHLIDYIAKKAQADAPEAPQTGAQTSMKEPGIGNGGQGDADEHEVNTTTHKMTSAEIRDFVDTIGDITYLETLIDGEVNNPEFPDGRKTVIDAIQSRIKKLGERASA